MTKEILIYEDWVHFIPTGKGWADGLIKLGHNVYNIPHKYDISQVSQYLDVIIYFDIMLDNMSINSFRQYKKLNPNCKIIGIIGSEYKEKYKEYSDIIDLWCSITYYNSAIDNKFENLLYVPLAANEDIFYPINDKSNLYDCSFIGQFGNTGHGYRKENIYLYPILDNKKLHNFMAGFEYNNYKHNFIQYNFLNNIYNSTKINLNFHYDNQKSKNRCDFNGRVYEVAMSGNFQLCDHPYLKNVFGNSIGYSDENSWLDTFYYYLEHTSERIELAEESRKIALENHTWKQRMKLIHDYLIRI